MKRPELTRDAELALLDMNNSTPIRLNHYGRRVVEELISRGCLVIDISVSPLGKYIADTIKKDI